MKTNSFILHSNFKEITFKYLVTLLNFALYSMVQSYVVECEIYFKIIYKLFLAIQYTE